MKRNPSDVVNLMYVRLHIDEKVDIILQIFEDEYFDFDSHQEILGYIDEIRKLIYGWTTRQNNEGSKALIAQETAAKRIKGIQSAAKSYVESDAINKTFYVINIINELQGLRQGLRF